MSNMDKIKRYDLYTDYIGEINHFELANVLSTRSDLEKDYANLTSSERTLLKTCDKKLLENVALFYSAFNNIYQFKNREPITHWWANLDLIISGKIIVNIDENTIYWAGEHPA